MEQTQPKKQYHVHYGPAGGRTRVDFDELWRYKDLIWLFVKRDFTVLYKQTVLGPAWILINPLLSMAMYTVMFGTIANLSTGGVPQPLFYLAGTAVWTFFSSCINKVSGTFTTNSNIFSKVYFPRLAMPISTMLSGLINFVVQFVMFFCLLLFIWRAVRWPPTGRPCRCCCLSCCKWACWVWAAASSCPALPPVTVT